MDGTVFAFTAENLGPALLAGVPAVVNAVILVHVLRNLPRDRVSGTFALFVALLVVWQSYDVMVRISATEETALFWRRLLYPGQMLAFAVGVHFALLYADRPRLVESAGGLAALYGSAFFWIGTHQETLIHRPFWGFIAAPDSRPVYFVELAWGAVLSLSMTGILGWNALRPDPDPDRKAQARLIFAGMAAPVAIGMFTEFALPLAGLQQMPLTSTTLSFFSIATAFALTRLKLFAVSSATAATAVLETVRDALVIATPEGRLLYANREAAVRFGLNRDRVRSHSVRELFPDEASWTSFRSRVWDATVAGTSTVAHRTRLRGADGRQLPVLASTAPVPVSRWGQPGVLVVATDVSELERAADDLAAARDAAEAASRAKSAFVANMSHELRTPLNAILGYSDLVTEVLEDEGRQDIVRDMRRIKSSGEHLLSLINDILDLSKIEAGRLEIVVEDFDLAEVVAEVRSIGEPLCARNRNRLRVECGPIGRMQTDKIRTRQVLLNLLSNAAKFTENGEVALVVEPDGEEGVRIEVRDTGIGMTPEQLGRLFERFAQVHGDERKYGGTGLGLLLTKRFCEMMGGDVTVASTKGSGSAFTVRLPRRAQRLAVTAA
jgi:PAS domain S-box-containing protein